MASVLCAGTEGRASGSATSWRFQSGDTIAPGRRALKLLGGGDRYEAYVAWDDRLYLPVVAKVLRRHLMDDPSARMAIAAEAEALERLQHPVLVRSFEAALDADRPHLVLEYLDGPRLSTLIRKYGPLAAEQLVPLARQLCSALQFMAGEGWVHLDVKPRNIVMTSSPRLIDLSVARRVGVARHISRPVGTDAYMAPEQCDPARFPDIGPPADIWGLGATLFEALTGRQAFPADGGGRFPQLRIRPAALPDKAPPALAEAVQACLIDDPAQRPAAAELDDMLEPLSEWSARAIRRLR
jgi:eukaryotic-like serine/threonine-protein kinase